MLLRSTLIMGPAVVMPRLAAFAITLVLVHHLPATQFGLYALVILTGEVIDMTASSWVRIGLLRLDIATPESWRDGLKRSYLLSALLTSAGVAAAFIASIFLARHDAREFFLALAVYIPANAFLRLGLTTLQLRQQNTVYSMIESGRALFQFTGIILLAGSGRSDLTFLAYSLATTTPTLAAGAIAFFASRIGLPRNSAVSAGYGARLQYGAPLIVLTLATYALTSSDRFALQAFAGPALVGLYAAAYVLGRQPVELIANAVNQAAFPELMKRFDKGGAAAAEQFLREVGELFLLLTISAAVFLWTLAPFLATALLPPAYRAVAVSIIPLTTASALLFTTKTFLFDNIFHAHRHNWRQIASDIPAAIVTVIAATLLVPRFGANGAALTALTGAGAGLATSLIMTRRLLRIAIPMRRLLEIAAITAAAGLAVVALNFVLPALPPAGLLLACASGYMGVWCAAVLLIRPPALAGLLRQMQTRYPSN